MRADLMALTPDDLATLGNRGLVKRAHKDLDKMTCDLSEAENGTVTVYWQEDDVTCTIAVGQTLSEAVCTCVATELCRHLIRSVLAYQQTTPTDDITQSPPLTVWDPGQISDADLEAHFRKADLTRWRKTFDEGHVVELVRSAKPSAQFHTLSLTLRFLVPHDLHYTHCDCNEQAPCRHVALAVWAFRLLAPDREAALLTTRQMAWPIPGDVLAEVEAALTEFVAVGLAGARQPLLDRLRRLEEKLRAENLIWPAETLTDIITVNHRYATHDARFDPVEVANLMGELCIRMDAIRSNTDAVPQLFVRGTATDRNTEVGMAHLLGLGCEATVYKGGVTLSAYLQDATSGAVVAIQRDFADPDDNASTEGMTPLPFAQLARRPVTRGISLATIGAQKLSVTGGHRTANYQFIPGRARATTTQQPYHWETLRAPLLAEDFNEIRARLTMQPPSVLRPRRVTANLYVCPVASVREAHFNPATQDVLAVLGDAAGNEALLQHPYTSRGQSGAEALLTLLTGQPDSVRFVAGRVQLAGWGEYIVFEPTALVYESDGTRQMLQPWVAETVGLGQENQTTPPMQPAHPIADYPMQISALLGELLLNGLERSTASLWQDLAQQGEALGFVQLVGPIKQLAAHLTEKNSALNWNWHPAAVIILELAVLCRLARENLTENKE